jgi:hypothetical protein
MRLCSLTILVATIMTVLVMVWPMVRFRIW